MKVVRFSRYQILRDLPGRERDEPDLDIPATVHSASDFGDAWNRIADPPPGPVQLAREFLRELRDGLRTPSFPAIPMESVPVRVLKPAGHEDSAIERVVDEQEPSGPVPAAVLSPAVDGAASLLSGEAGARQDAIRRAINK